MDNAKSDNVLKIDFSKPPPGYFALDIRAANSNYSFLTGRSSNIPDINLQSEQLSDPNDPMYSFYLGPNPPRVQFNPTQSVAYTQQVERKSKKLQMTDRSHKPNELSDPNDPMYSFYLGPNPPRPQLNPAVQTVVYTKSTQQVVQKPETLQTTDISLERGLLSDPNDPMYSFYLGPNPPRVQFNSSEANTKTSQIRRMPEAFQLTGRGQYGFQQPGNNYSSLRRNYYFTQYARRGNLNSDTRKRKGSQEHLGNECKKVSTEQKNDWTLKDAKRALDFENDFVKTHKDPLLIIRFPDLELNRDVILGYHPKIQSVNFLNPVTARFCFVKLKNSSCLDQVIQDLRRTKYGDGYLSVEIKKDKPNDVGTIDPFCLFVGNLAQEVILNDIIKIYPKYEKIHMGYSYKGRHHFALVWFRTVNDAIEAFQNTYNIEIYNKSVKIRFKRHTRSVIYNTSEFGDHVPIQEVKTEPNVNSRQQVYNEQHEELEITGQQEIFSGDDNDDEDDVFNEILDRKVDLTSCD